MRTTNVTLNQQKLEFRVGIKSKVSGRCVILQSACIYSKCNETEIRRNFIYEETFIIAAEIGRKVAILEEGSFE